MTTVEREELLKKIDSAVTDAQKSFQPGFSSKLKRLLTDPKKVILRKIILGWLGNRYLFLLKTKTFFGATMYLDNTDQALWFSGMSLAHAEIKLTKYLIKNIDQKEREIFLDVGANYGFYSVLVSTISNARVQVHGFEPSHNLFTILSKNARLLKNIFIHNKAVYSSSGSIPFFDNSTAISTTDKAFAERNIKEGKKYKEVVVPAITIDDYVREHTISPTFIKIDVEGAEKDVLLGAAQTLATYSPDIALEMWKYNNKNHLEAADILLKAGYRAFYITDTGELTPNSDIASLISDDGFDNLLFKKI